MGVRAISIRLYSCVRWLLQQHSFYKAKASIKSGFPHSQGFQWNLFVKQESHSLFIRLKEESDVRNVEQYFRNNQDYESVFKKEQVNLENLC